MLKMPPSSPSRVFVLLRSKVMCRKTDRASPKRSRGTAAGHSPAPAHCLGDGSGQALL